MPISFDPVEVARKIQLTGEGRWGDRDIIMRAAIPWYEKTNVPEADIMKGAAHPVAQAAVESSKLGEKESFLEHLEVIFTPIKYRIESLEWRSLLQADHANDGFLDDAVRNRGSSGLRV
ncbi:hypothetical protein [Glutamicibacter arilaitensis]|uniref:hypothetical protein n=1 Tax=Glutamicibacter arilaitensis TaxID=256701 RepID=UPI003F90E5E7